MRRRSFLRARSLRSFATAIASTKRCTDVTFATSRKPRSTPRVPNSSRFASSGCVRSTQLGCNGAARCPCTTGHLTNEYLNPCAGVRELDKSQRVARELKAGIPVEADSYGELVVKAVAEPIPPIQGRRSDLRPTVERAHEPDAASLVQMTIEGLVLSVAAWFTVSAGSFLRGPTSVDPRAIT